MWGTVFKIEGTAGAKPRGGSKLCPQNRKEASVFGVEAGGAALGDEWGEVGRTGRAKACRSCTPGEALQTLF